MSARVHPYHGYLDVKDHPEWKGLCDPDHDACPRCGSGDVNRGGGLIQSYHVSESCECRGCGLCYVRHHIAESLIHEAQTWYTDVAGTLRLGRYGCCEPKALPCHCGGYLTSCLVDPQGIVKEPGPTCPLTGAPGLLVRVASWKPSESDYLRWTCKDCGVVHEELRDPDPEEPPKMRMLKTKLSQEPPKDLRVFYDEDLSLEERAKAEQVRADYFGAVRVGELPEAPEND